MFRFCLFFLIITGCPALVFAQAPVVLTDSQDNYRLGRMLEYLEDPEGTLTMDDVISPEISSGFVQSRTNVPSFGFTKFAYWIRIHFRNHAASTTDWRLVLEFPNMNDVAFYLPRVDGTGFDVTRTGTSHPFAL